MTWRIIVTPVARKMLADIPDRRIQKKLSQRIEELAKDPESIGKPLQGDLAGFRSTRAAGQHYRILYKIE